MELTGYITLQLTETKSSKFSSYSQKTRRSLRLSWKNLLFLVAVGLKYLKIKPKMWSYHWLGDTESWIHSGLFKPERMGPGELGWGTYRDFRGEERSLLPRGSCRYMLGRWQMGGPQHCPSCSWGPPTSVLLAEVTGTWPLAQPFPLPFNRCEPSNSLY